MEIHTGKKSLNIVGPQIARIRNSLGMSQPQLAAKCQLAGWDVSRDIIARIEGQVRCVEDAELATLAQVLGVLLEELFPTAIRKKLPKR